MRLIKRVARTTENIAHLMTHEFFNASAAGAEIFARIEFFRVFAKGFPDAGRQGEAQIGVDIHLGAADATGDLNVRLGHASRIGAHFAAVFVDFLHEILRHAGSPVQHQWIIPKSGVHQSLFD